MEDLRFLTISRFFAAILVVFFHFSGEISSLNNLFFWNGNISVSYFFCLSGFILLVSSWKKKEEGTFSLSNFYIARFARIYPLFLLWMVTVFIVYRFMDMKGSGIFNFLFCLLGLQAFSPERALSLNFPAWSLSVEFFFYALFPLFLTFAHKVKLRTLTIAIVLFYAISQFWLNSPVFGIRELSLRFFGDAHLAFLYHFPALHLSTFLIGILGGRIFLLTKSIQTTWYELPVLLVLMVISFVFITKHNTIFIHNGLLAPIFTAIIILLARASLTHIPNKLSQIFAFLGEASYGIYILQFPVHIALMGMLSVIFHIKDGVHTFWMGYFVSYVAILLLVSCLCFTYIEVPARKYLNQKMKKLRF